MAAVRETERTTMEKFLEERVRALQAALKAREDLDEKLRNKLQIIQFQASFLRDVAPERAEVVRMAVWDIAALMGWTKGETK